MNLQEINFHGPQVAKEQAEATAGQGDGDGSKERVRRGGGGPITLEPTPSLHQFWRRRGFDPSGKMLAKKLRRSEDAEVSKRKICKPENHGKGTSS